MNFLVYLQVNYYTDFYSGRRRRSAAAMMDKNFVCDVEGCDKRYYEKRHLLEHQFLKHGRARPSRKCPGSYSINLGQGEVMAVPRSIPSQLNPVESTSIGNKLEVQSLSHIDLNFKLKSEAAQERVLMQAQYNSGNSHELSLVPEFHDDDDDDCIAIPAQDTTEMCDQVILPNSNNFITRNNPVIDTEYIDENVTNDHDEDFFAIEKHNIMNSTCDKSSTENGLITSNIQIQDCDVDTNTNLLNAKNECDQNSLLPLEIQDSLNYDVDGHTDEDNIIKLPTEL